MGVIALLLMVVLCGATVDGTSWAAVASDGRDDDTEDLTGRDGGGRGARFLRLGLRDAGGTVHSARPDVSATRLPTRDGA